VALEASLNDLRGERRLARSLREAWTGRHDARAAVDHLVRRRELDRSLRRSLVPQGLAGRELRSSSRPFLRRQTAHRAYRKLHRDLLMWDIASESSVL
jgi:hypothetical protein